MRRVSLLVSLVAVVLLGLVAIRQAPTITAQDATPIAAGHPLVGAWRLDTDAVDPANPLSLAVFSSDGTYTEAAVDGFGVGVWTPTGPTSAALTIIEQSPGDGSQPAIHNTVRGTVEVAPDGQSFTATYTLQFNPNEMPMMPTGELGPGTATGTRITVEPMGTAVSGLADAFAAAFGSPPAGTPTS